MTTARAACAAFPAGLYQPPGSFRFAVDALLLAAFAAEAAANTPSPVVLDLGCGCGVAGLGVLLLRPESRATGVDVQENLLQAAQANALGLGFAARFSVLHLDLVQHSEHQRIPQAAFTIVAMNPPFRNSAAGRLPASASRRTALFATPETLPAFLAAARHAMTHEGQLALVYPAEQLEALCLGLAAENLRPTVIRPVRAREASAPIRVLVKARHASSVADASYPQPETPLTLFRGTGNRHTPEALAFCPFLTPSF
jgi:Predicted O-methyltransferase